MGSDDRAFERDWGAPRPLRSAEADAVRTADAQPTPAAGHSAVAAAQRIPYVPWYEAARRERRQRPPAERSAGAPGSEPSA